VISYRYIYHTVARIVEYIEVRVMDHIEEKTESKVEEALPAYDKLFTYSDYLLWDDDVRRELIDGVIYLMAAPNLQHQEILGNLYVQFRAFLKGKSCKVFMAPIDVRLNADTLDNTVVQPDIMIVCDHNKLDKAGIIGAPDMVIEILSPSTSKYDRTTKFNAYLKAGIREYWIIDPEARSLAVNILTDNNYITHAYTGNEIVPVHVLEGCTVNLPEVFE